MSLVAEYKASLKNVAIEEYVDLFFFRPLAFLFVKLVYSTTLTPNQVTILSMVVGIGSGILFGIGGTTFIVLGGLFLVLATVLDCADGQLARMKKNGTPFGRILDGVVDYVYTISAFLGIGVGGRVGSMGMLAWWILVVAAGTSYAVQAALLDYYRNEFLANSRGEQGFLEDEFDEVSREYERLKGVRGQGLMKFLLRVYLKYSSYLKPLKPIANVEGKTNPADCVKKNSLLIRLWALNGTSTHVFALACCAFFGRLDLFLWYILGFGSLFSLVVYAFQRRIDRS